MDEKLHYPSSYIRTLAIRLNDQFNFDNLPHPERRIQDESPEKPFVGRIEQKTKFKAMLKNGKGVFLVTGYRGMGKTSFVNKVIEEFNLEFYKTQYYLHSIKITLAQNKPTETEILRLMVSSLRDKCGRISKIQQIILFNKVLSFCFRSLGFTFLALFFLLLLKEDGLKSILTVEKNFIADGSGLTDNLRWLTFCCLLSSLILATFHFLLNQFNSVHQTYNRLEDLYRRCHASTSFETSDSGEISFEALNAKLTPGGGKRMESYPIASSKEIEYELTAIINTLKEKAKTNFIFVFDELDKVDQPGHLADDSIPVSYSSPSPERAQLDQLRERKRIIQQIIAGLKNFFTVTQIPFVFIAGREMFEASMADIADRQSSISSIFNYVFYVESLLKEQVKGSGALSKTIENYLYRIIWGKDPEKEENSGENLYKIDKKLYNNAEEAEEFSAKLNMLLQNFVVYLTYRSNGSPKKLIRLLHEFVQVIENGNTNEHLARAVCWGKNQQSDNHSETSYYLIFDYAQQQRIGFISYLYRPFLVKYGNSFKKYSDNLIVSTSFLFDHLLKFHPFAFSHTHLELIPEVLSANRTPALRDHIKKIIEYLTQNHIRETEIGLFDFKFYNKTVNEIYFLSKTFEEESAAFNFTLDESYLIKLHVRGKLLDLRSVYEKQSEQIGSDGTTIFSIAYLNGVLGDLHFFDQEYDDAIVAYSDVVTSIKSLANNPDISMQNFVLLLKYKLKLGLTFEKIKSFEESLSLYSDAAQDVRMFLSSRLSGNLLTEEHLKAVSKSNTYINSSLNDLLQIANQAFLAKMVLQEKMGVEGITALKTAINLGSFLHLTKKIAQYGGTNTTIVSNFFLQMGIVLYLKNSVRAFEWTLDTEDKKGDGIPTEYLADLENIKKVNMFDQNGFALNPSDKKNEDQMLVRRPVVAMNMYCLGLKYLLEKRIKDLKINFDEAQQNPLVQISNLLKPSFFKKYHTSVSKIHFRYIAIYLSNIGDCMLGMLKADCSDGFDLESLCNIELLARESKTSTDNQEDQVEQFLSYFEDKSGQNNAELISVKRIIYFYYLSAYYFDKCSRSRSNSFQLRKILYLIRLVSDQKLNTKRGFKCRYKNLDRTNQMKLFFDLLEKTIIKDILKVASSNAEFSDIHDYNKFISFQEASKIPPAEAKIRNNISNFPDTREAIVLFAHIKLRMLDYKYEELKEVFSQDYSISTQYLRLIELTYGAKFYERRIEKALLLYHQEQKINSVNVNKWRENIKNDCTGYLHCLTHVIQIIDVYDNDYLVGNSFLAYHHLRLARFFDFMENENNEAINFLGLDKKLVKDAEKYFARNFSIDNTPFLHFDKYYNYGMAASYYDKAIKLHSAGHDYKKALNETHYLEDDLNDASYHFGAAMDRYLIFNGVIEKNMNLALAYSNNPGYSFQSYV